MTRRLPREPVRCRHCGTSLPQCGEAQEPLLGCCADCAAWYYALEVAPLMALPMLPVQHGLSDTS